ncbi:hypothetical protein SOVF_113730 [Spinacia oleracea]|uniref:Transcription termination factor MTERF2, chloroplastic-like n=1 Tax=Spinacia oleracea TaxID=3562 RepID=A0A9R0I752_SPIOL|nr:transcription termination factor MTERF2, chloroplastic-like [Spinacia oleracea]XP_021843873.1 transcription termination factor MTERF2, chloroplastic-like [Spinacia oleracea]KNA13781.1 hypothetical protein SOVF_113730 [Spinacia oleracea]
MAANPPLRRVVNFLQKRFFNTTPSPKYPKQPSTILKPKIKTEISNSILPKSSFSIQYLTKSCGLSLDSAISASNKVSLEENNKKQFDSVVLFLKSYNFSDTHIGELVKKRPYVLLCKTSTNLEPKFQFLAESGIKGLNLPKLIVSSPTILFRGLNSQLKPAMTIIKRLLPRPDRIEIVVQRGPWVLTSDWKVMQHNLDYLIKQGVFESRIKELIVLHPRCLYQDTSRIRYVVKMITEMGVMPCDLKFIHALRVMLSLSKSSWERKVKFFESLGWTNDEVISTFTKSPACLSCSEEKLRNGIDYFVNTVKIDRQIIISYPKVLMYSVQKRVIPRFTIWKILEERKLIKGMQFIWVLNKSEKEFIEQYVTKYSSEIPHLLQMYLSGKDSISAVRS